MKHRHLALLFALSACNSLPAQTASQRASFAIAQTRPLHPHLPRPHLPSLLRLSRRLDLLPRRPRDQHLPPRRPLRPRATPASAPSSPCPRTRSPSPPSPAPTSTSASPRTPPPTACAAQATHATFVRNVPTRQARRPVPDRGHPLHPRPRRAEGHLHHPARRDLHHPPSRLLLPLRPRHQQLLRRRGLRRQGHYRRRARPGPRPPHLHPRHPPLRNKIACQRRFQRRLITRPY